MTDDSIAKKTIVDGETGLRGDGVSHQDVERPAAWEGLAYGGRLMDRFLPMPELGPRTDDTWGGDNVRPRDVLNGIEAAEFSYWGGNILRGANGTYHLFVCRWPERHEKGHMAWPQSDVVHAISDNRFGPYRYHQDIGPGHNPEVYRLENGRCVCYVIGAYYLGETLDGPWTKHEFDFDPRGRKVIGNLSNMTFAQREDGSFLMICRGGGSWVSKDGLSTYHQVSESRAYPDVAGRFEDPVVWRDRVQYHMIVNDWHGRIAYYLRSKDGIQWKTDAGEAYVPGIATYRDGRKEDWYKYERMKILQDEQMRAIQANFAVIDCPKRSDLPNDEHSSKNISIPLQADRLLRILDTDRIAEVTDQIRVKIEAESGFDPNADIALDTLRFGAPEEVDFGRGCVLVSTEPVGKDLVLVFDGSGNGFEDHNFAAKLLGRTTSGALLFGYARLPWLNYLEPALSARTPQVVAVAGTTALKIPIDNFGQVASGEAAIEVTVRNAAGAVVFESASPIPVVPPYGQVLVAMAGLDNLNDESGYSFQTTITQDGKPLPRFEGRVSVADLRG